MKLIDFILYLDFSSCLKYIRNMSIRHIFLLNIHYFTNTLMIIKILVTNGDFLHLNDQKTYVRSSLTREKRCILLLLL